MAVTKGSKTTIESGDGATYAASSVFTKLANVLSIKPPKVDADDIETSNMDSPNDMKQFTAGWGDGGVVSCKIQYVAAANATIYGLFRKDSGYRIIFPDNTYPNGSRWGFDGFLKSFSNEVERAGLITADVDIKVSGTPLFIPSPSGS